jgi:hypothetical protein
MVAIDRAEMVRTFANDDFWRWATDSQDLLVGLPFQLMRGLWEKHLVLPSNAAISFDQAADGMTRIAEAIGSCQWELPACLLSPAIRNPFWGR